VLKQSGLILVKCQYETESGEQRLSHMELAQGLLVSGFKLADLMVLQQGTIPAMRVNHQKSARKNHSFLLVARFRR
jgi:hypothetical protein